MQNLIQLIEFIEEQYHFLKNPNNPRSRDHYVMIPHRYIRRTQRQDVLDALSSLLTDTERNVCTAVCIDPNGKLLVANNDGDYGYAFDILRQLQNNSLEENVQKNALEKVASLAKHKKITKRFQDKISSEIKKFSTV